MDSVSAAKSQVVAEIMGESAKSCGDSPVRTLLECNAIVLAMFSLLLLNYL